LNEPHRSCSAPGVIESEADFDKPFIAICTVHRLHPRHAHLNEVGALVNASSAGGRLPFIFNTIGIDDGIAMGHSGMKFSLPSASSSPTA